MECIVAGSEVGEDQRVDGRGDVRAANMARPRTPSSAIGPSMMELLDGCSLGDGHSVQHAERPGVPWLLLPAAGDREYADHAGVLSALGTGSRA